MELQNLQIKIKTLKLFWIESPQGFTAQTSFGFAHICKLTSKATVMSFTGTRESFFSSIKNINELKAKVEEMHQITLKTALMYIQPEIKIK